MEKRPGGFTVLCLLCAGVLAWLLPQPSVAWHPNPARPDGIGGSRAPAHHYAGLPPLSAPPPTAGADLPPPSRAPEQAAPHFGFPLQPTLGSAAAPSAGGEGYPFIGSNPTVPLPTGMTDTASVLPLPDTATTKVVGFAALLQVQIVISGLLVFCSILFLSTT